MLSICFIKVKGLNDKIQKIFNPLTEFNLNQKISWCLHPKYPLFLSYNLLVWGGDRPKRAIIKRERGRTNTKNSFFIVRFTNISKI